MDNTEQTGSNRVNLHFGQHQKVVADSLEKLGNPMREVGDVLVQSLKNGRKALMLGNGGSAAEASHFAGELVGRFSTDRQPFPAFALSNDPSVVTCIANDFGYEMIFERQIEALAGTGDVVFGFTTSGNSENVRRGLSMAREKGAITVALTGAAGLIGERVDYLLAVPSTVTARIQEVHLLFLHIWCDHVDQSIDQR